MLSYTGYGFVLMRIFDCLFDGHTTGMGFIFLNIIGFFIALSGIVFIRLMDNDGKGLESMV